MGRDESQERHGVRSTENLLAVMNGNSVHSNFGLLHTAPEIQIPTLEVRMKTWVLIADRGHARIFSWESYTDDWTITARFEFPEGRLREGETQTDRPTSFSTQGGGRSSPEPHVDRQHLTAATFSNELVEYLNLARQQGRFDVLWVAAPPLFLGEFRQHLPSTLSPLVAREWNKDLTQLADLVVKTKIEQLVIEDKKAQ